MRTALDNTSDQAKEKVAVLGAGAVGTSLARQFVRAGYAVVAVISSREADARRLAGMVGAPVAASTVEALPEDVAIVFCCVPDDAVEVVAEALFLLPRDWSGTLVAHTAGARTSEALAPLAVRGAHTLSFHPLQSFPPGSGPERFGDIVVALEGSPAALDAGRVLATALGAQPVVLAREDKAFVHLAASMASNFFVTLMGMAGEVLGRAGLDRQQGTALLRPLVEGTWQSLRTQTPEDALTGPIARGDHVTVQVHLDLLTRQMPYLMPVYVALATETVRVAVRGGRLSQEKAQALLERLQVALEPHRDSLF